MVAVFIVRMILVLIKKNRTRTPTTFPQIAYPQSYLDRTVSRFKQLYYVFQQQRPQHPRTFNHVFILPLHHRTRAHHPPFQLRTLPPKNHGSLLVLVLLVMLDGKKVCC